MLASAQGAWTGRHAHAPAPWPKAAIGMSALWLPNAWLSVQELLCQAGAAHALRIEGHCLSSRRTLLTWCLLESWSALAECCYFAQATLHRAPLFNRHWCSTVAQAQPGATGLLSPHLLHRQDQPSPMSSSTTPPTLPDAALYDLMPVYSLDLPADSSHQVVWLWRRPNPKKD